MWVIFARKNTMFSDLCKTYKNMDFFKYFYVAFVLLLLVEYGNSTCSSNYGAKPCQLLPAPYGQAPPCAKPGQTFCEYPTHYPREVIQHLLEKWKYNYSSFFQSESPTDYSYVINEPKKQKVENFGFYPDATYGKIVYPSNTYPVNNDSYFIKATITHPSHAAPSNYQSGYQKPFVNFQNNRNIIWNKWNERMNKYRRKKRELQSTISQKYANNERNKRQVGNMQSLCASRKQFIMPRAALNKEGNWMYIVNLPEVDNKLTQLVQSENCISSQCSGICSLPIGFTSKCEQKYVQKRLVGLESNGNQLYTDIFWFPSCCVCTIVNN